MTYGVGMMVDAGLVLMSDTRTNAGVDNVSVFRKMFHWSVPGERIITVLTAGNLGTTQAVVSLIEERTKAPAERHPSILTAPTMFQVASEIGTLLREVIARARAGGMEGEEGDVFSASLIVAGQIKGMEPQVFRLYPEGNFIEASFDTPFFQIGETKYGKPILVRGYDRAMPFAEAVKLLLVSFDSTIAANLSVGLPLDLMVIARDTFVPLHARRILATDPYFTSITTAWNDALRSAFKALPAYSMQT